MEVYSSTSAPSKIDLESKSIWSGRQRHQRFSFFLPDRQLKQEMDSPFLVFDLIAGNAGPEVWHDARNLIRQKRDHRKVALGFIRREEGQSGSGGDCFAEFNGSHQSHFTRPRLRLAIRHSAIDLERLGRAAQVARADSLQFSRRMDLQTPERWAAWAPKVMQLGSNHCRN
jgi:hypothetical protein